MIERPARRSPGAVAGWSGVAAGSIFAVALAVVRAAGHAQPVVRAAEWWPLGDIALGGLVLLPAILAALGLRGRPPALLAGGMLCLGFVLPLSLLGVFLVVPGILFLVAYARMPRPQGASARRLAAVVVPALLAVAAIAAALFGQDQPVCYRSITYSDGRTIVTRDRAAEADFGPSGGGQSFGPPGPGVVSQGGGCTSDIITPLESFVAISLAAAAVGAASVLAPRARLYGDPRDTASAATSA